MNKYMVYHNIYFLNYAFKTDSVSELPMAILEKVATVICTTIDRAFELTNHIDCAWWENERVDVYNPTNKPLKYRSTSVGDVIYDYFNEKYFLCCDVGWKEIKIIL